MPRRYGFNRLVSDMARISEREGRERQKRERAIQRERERVRRESLKLRAQADKEARQKYTESRIRETADLNEDLSNRMLELSEILTRALSIDQVIILDSLRIKEGFREFALPSDLQNEPTFVSKEDYFAKISKPSALEKLIPGWEKRYQKQLIEGEKLYKEYVDRFDKFVSERNQKISLLKEEYNEEKQAYDLKVRQHNQEVDDLESSYKNSAPIAINAYCTMVLERSEYPDGFPKEFRIAYVPESKELVVEYELPHKSAVPAICEYKYVKTRDAIEEKPRKASAIKEIYQDLVSAICLRTIHELFEADQRNHLEVVVFNGFVNDIDPSTGKDIRPCLISIRTTKDKFQDINLAKIDKKACLRNLGAQVSPRPDELMAVKPIIEFNMVDKRFVEESDVLSDLESRPNLMELSPFEFENLINNLFGRIGFDCKTTQPSRDGGVDVVAFDPRPILGGKVVIQAKRYKNTVGVSAVRDLYGTMINEGANKGILVTTSHYGKDAYDFSNDKPVELIDGGGLLYLLDQNGVKARIIFPED